jgi:hypothetical protein
MKRAMLSVTVLALLVALVTATPIGPLFVYGWLVPVIGPLIPKPAGVPSRANAEYHWKGLGLAWKWEDRVTDGCASWLAADSFGGPVRTLYIYDEPDRCGESSISMWRLSFDDHTTYGNSGHDWPYEECSYKIDDATIDRYQLQIEELLDANSGLLERDLLTSMLSEIEQVDGSALVAQQYGCRAAK